jgi:hypothetical protein
MCGGKPKPALECPLGYSVGCNPTGGEHWGCIKAAASAGAGVSGSAGASATGGASTEAAKTADYLDHDDDGDMVPTILEDTVVKAAVFIKLGGVKGEAKGNADMQWKVEEGEKTAASDAYLKFDGVKGESTKGDVPEQSDFEILIDSRKVQGWDPKKKEEVKAAAPKTSDDVEDEEDLALFVLAKSSDDSRMESISMNYTKIEFAYRSDAKLFGVIPSSLLQDVSLEGGAVNLRKPWYSFLFTGAFDLDDIKAAVEEKKKDKGHKETIEIASWSFGASNSGKVNVAVGDVNGDGVSETVEDLAAEFAALSEVMKATYDLALQKK